MFSALDRLKLLAVLALFLQAPLSAQDPAPDGYELPAVEVIGRPEALAGIPGSGSVLDSETLTQSRVFTTNEALRKVPGTFVRDEEGFGLRPNIGIRGLNPTRSNKVLLLEDGIPFTLAPYGDNGAYYHPPVDRFDHIEVLKGSGQILFGPQTIGGVINYVTPSTPRRASGFLTLAPGNRDYFNGHLRLGAPLGRSGLLFDYVRKQGDGARENLGSRLNDVNVKTSISLGERHSLSLRGNYYSEDSRVTYSGLTEAEFLDDPRQNPFKNDSMLLDRWGASASHKLALGESGALTTTAYGYIVSRNWWRQSSFSNQRPNDASDPDCAGIANLDTTCGNEGRLRDYTVWGVEPRLRVSHGLLGLLSQADIGVRAHFEHQERRQINGDGPTSRSPGAADDVNSGLREDNDRENQAYSAFLQNRLFAGNWSFTPGVRVEHVRYERINRLPVAGGPNGVSGQTTLTEVIPGFGVTYAPAAAATLFAGVHRGFAPPRTEDIISNTTGGVVELDAELSWNYEVGVRSRMSSGAQVEATVFRMDFANQIIPASLAGGIGATLTSAGRTLHQGLELAARLDGAGLFGSSHNVYLRGAYTYLPTARFEGSRFVYVGTGGSDAPGKVYNEQDASGTRTQVSVTGSRLPYAPKHLLTATLGLAVPFGLDTRLEAVYVGPQFGDALNTSALVSDGQQGRVGGYTIWNAAVNYTLAPLRTTFFVTAKNLLDKVYVVDRVRGIIPGSPRLVQAGFNQRF
ncbi:MAG: TonB-dependent receptor [Gemmatimonadota bacterium]|nr:TonB-dependent receptor [Gemmatimonadota bacterium]